MKLILDHGIDYAVAAKRGDLLHSRQRYRFGTASAYASASGGEDQFAISTFLIFGRALLDAARRAESR